MEIHPEDWKVWQEMIGALKRGERPNLASDKRKRAVLAIAKIVERAQDKRVFDVAE